jgi:hypothetical protein
MRMRKTFALTLIAGFMTLLNVASQPAFAASGLCSGGTCTPAVDLDFQVVIPNFVRLTIGSPGATVDLITFDMSSNPQDIGNNVAQPGSSSVNVEVIANGGAATGVQVDADTSGTNGLDCDPFSGSCISGTHTIDWQQIDVQETGACGAVTPPDLINSGITSTLYTGFADGSVNWTGCTWTFTYLNDLVPLDGTYSGTVNYTATAQP